MPRTMVLFTALVLAITALMFAGHHDGPAVAGSSTTNVAGTWEGTWTHRAGSGQITLRLAQEGSTVTGTHSLAAVIPLFGDESQRQFTMGQEVREAQLEDSTLIFYVEAPDAPGGRVNFTLTVGGETMTGTACGYTCATLKLKKSKL
jgi:hypothetical protein